MSQGPNFMIIISDCTRPDELSCHGYNKETTPNIDKIASEGARFTNAYSQGVWTLPTHASLFTGLYPSEHGLLSASENLNIHLDKEITTLAQQLSEEDYVTAGISNNPWVGELSGMDRGFDFYMESDGEIKDDLGLEVDIPTKISMASKIQSISKGFIFKLMIPYLVKRPEFTEFSVDLAKRVIKYSEREDKNFFIFMNLMDTHQPYYPPKNILNEVSDRDYGFLSSIRDNYRIKKYYDGEDTESTVPILNDYYDASLKYQDRELGKLFDLMRDREVLDDTLMFFTSDHGKHLGEHDLNEKMNYMKDNILRIPLIVRYPDLFGSDVVVDDDVQLIDINYSIRDLIGLDMVHENDFSLLDVLDGESRGYSYIEAELPFNTQEGDLEEQDEVKCVVSSGKKIIESKDKGILYSKYGEKLEDEEFTSKLEDQDDSNLLNYLKNHEKSLKDKLETEKEKKRLKRTIKELKDKDNNI